MPLLHHSESICGAKHPHIGGIVCTRPAGHPSIYHHQEGLMGCFAWMRREGDGS